VLTLDRPALGASAELRHLDPDLGDRPLPLTNGSQRIAASNRVWTTAEDLAVGYDNQGVGTSRESLSLGLPDCEVNDMPYAGDQRAERPVGSDDDLSSSRAES
jgi:hypothetical protein